MQPSPSGPRNTPVSLDSSLAYQWLVHSCPPSDRVGPQPKGISGLVPIPWDLLAAGPQNHPQRLWLLQAKYKYVILSLGLQVSSCGASLVRWGDLGP